MAANQKYFLTSTNDTLVTTARKLSTASGTATSVSACKIAKQTGWFVMAPQGSSNTTQASEPAFGNTQGYILDDTTLEGLVLQAGAVSCSVRVSQSSGSGTWVPHVVIGTRSSAGVFTQWVDIACTSTAGVGATLTTITGSGTASSDLAVNTGDKLYVNLYFDLTANSSTSNTATASLGENGTSDFIVLNVGTPTTKTQTAVARIQSTGLTLTQSAVARIQSVVTATQTAIARIQNTVSATQTAIARISNTGMTKTQSAIARISNTGMTATQPATARIQVVDPTKTQPATARIQVVGLTKTQTATAKIAAATGPQFVQSKSTASDYAGGTGQSVVLGAAPTQNNLLVAFISGANQLVSVSSLSGTGWTKAFRTLNSDGSDWIECWYKIAGSGESATISWTPSATNSTSGFFGVAEYSGIDTTTPLLTSSGNSTAVSGTTATTASVTPTAGKNALVVMSTTARYGGSFGTWSNEQVNSSTTGVTEREDAGHSGTNIVSGNIFDLIVASTSGSYQGSALSSTSFALTDNGIAVFQAAVPPVTKTQTATARIQVVGLTKTQSAVARIQNVVTKTQTAVARIQVIGLTKTQSAIARISKSFTFTQPATARISNTGMTKTQTAVARIQRTGLTLTQSAVARISKSFTKTQTAIARIQVVGLTKTQPATARIQVVGVVKTQPATARVQNTVTKTQTATARISTSSQVTKTQTAVARIQAVGLTKTQPATARVQITSIRTQTAVARIAVARTFTQTATAHIVSANLPHQTMPFGLTDTSKSFEGAATGTEFERSTGDTGNGFSSSPSQQQFGRS